MSSSNLLSMHGFCAPTCSKPSEHIVCEGESPHRITNVHIDRFVDSEMVIIFSETGNLMRRKLQPLFLGRMIVR